MDARELMALARLAAELTRDPGARLSVRFRHGGLTMEVLWFVGGEYTPESMRTVSRFWSTSDVEQGRLPPLDTLLRVILG